MKRVRLLVLVVSIGLIIALLACAAPPEGCEDVEAELAECESEKADLESDVDRLEDELAACEAPPEVYEWDMTYPLYRGTWDWLIVEKWCDDLREASGGRLDITPWAAGEFVAAWTEFDAVSTGTIQIDMDYGPYLIGIDPMFIYASGIPPFTLTRWEHYKVLYYHLGLEALLRDALAKHNVYYVATMPTNNNVMLSQTPVTTADWSALEIRAVGIYAELAAKAGAYVDPMAWGEIYGALAAGTINSVIAGPLVSQVVDADFYELNTYFLETPITPVDAWCLLVNLDAWNELPEDLQMLIYESTSYGADLFMGSYFGRDSEAREIIMGAPWNYTVTTLPPEEQAILAGYTLEILDEYSAEDPVYFAEATAILKAYMRSLGLLD